MSNKYQVLEEEMNGKFINRREEIRGLLITLIARGNMVLLGKAGTAKTDMVQTLARSIDTECFETLLTRTSSPEELWGCLDIKELEKGNYKRNTQNSLAEAQVGFVDECFKCNSAVLNGLLGIMAQRTYRNGTSNPQPVPLQILVGASNEMPEGGVDGELAPLWDRFEMRFVTEYIKDERNFVKLLHITSALEPSTKLTVAEIQQAQVEASRVNLDPIEGKIVELWKGLRKEGYLISDRKWRNCLKYIKANAYIDGRTEATEDDLAILANMFWNVPEQIKPIRKLVLSYVNPETVKAQELYDIATEIFAELGNFDKEDDSKNKEKYGMSISAKATEVHGKLVRTKKSLSTLQAELVKQSKNTKRVDEAITEVEEMILKVVNEFLFS